ncbi:hypothetical protein FB567DRAFT_595290 [Paraphoma chrysanthemicola]|uniref:Uncharacterized protein n=1 Tax=Paraphoma chrysanthemicola TaxID=798071 RepID=A0A8K0R2U0_9PLEO|nr:hypothetical protein FB567DRAFT_595290 [Paraphoma chrysanthemicola]
MAQDRIYTIASPVPMYILLVMSICLCMYFCFIGVVIVRLWFYQGALGPEAEKFMIVALDHKQKVVHKEPREVANVARHNRHTVFPQVEEHPATDSAANPFSDAHTIHESLPHPPTIPAITIEGAHDEDEDFESFEDPDAARRYFAEERRISRLPAFDQDDCGDGAEFPNVPYALTPVEEPRLRGLVETKTYLELGLRKASTLSEWLNVNKSYEEIHAARNSLLARKQMECVQTEAESRTACEELLDEVVKHVCVKYPEMFSRKTKNLQKYVRNEQTGKEYAIVKPFERPPLVLAARLAMDDFCIFMKDDFTRRWYLKASATLFPAGWNMRKYIGKSIDEIVDRANDPMIMWSSTLLEVLIFASSNGFPDMSNILHLHFTNDTLFTRTSTYIQTRAAKVPLSDALFIQRPVDLFSGNISNLVPSNLYVRREFQTFRLLPSSGAVVMSTRTEFKKLTDLSVRWEKAELMSEIGEWDEHEASFKGRDLWIRAVRAHCEGTDVFRDDETVSDAGDLNVV